MPNLFLSNSARMIEKVLHQHVECVVVTALSAMTTKEKNHDKGEQNDSIKKIE